MASIDITNEISLEQKRILFYRLLYKKMKYEDAYLNLYMNNEEKKYTGIEDLSKFLKSYLSNIWKNIQNIKYEMKIK